MASQGVCAVLSVIVLLGMAILGYCRWKYVNTSCLSEEDCKIYSRLVVDDLFEYAADAGKEVPIREAYWRALDISDREWIYLCKWMHGTGMVKLPKDWGLISIMSNNPPYKLALTSKSWELKMKEGMIVNNIGILGDGNSVGGNMNVGGWQNIGGEVTNENSLTASDVLNLVEALRVDGNNMSGLDKMRILASADFLEGEIQKGVSPDAMGGDLGKVVASVAEIVKTGSSFMGSTVSVLKVLGFM